MFPYFKIHIGCHLEYLLLIITSTNFKSIFFTQISLLSSDIGRSTTILLYGLKLAEQFEQFGSLEWVNPKFCQRLEYVHSHSLLHESLLLFIILGVFLSPPFLIHIYTHTDTCLHLCLYFF